MGRVISACNLSERVIMGSRWSYNPFGPIMTPQDTLGPIRTPQDKLAPLRTPYNTLVIVVLKVIFSNVSQYILMFPRGFDGSYVVIRNLRTHYDSLEPIHTINTLYEPLEHINHHRIHFRVVMCPIQSYFFLRSFSGS